jgi:hypothetical protein
MAARLQRGSDAMMPTARALSRYWPGPAFPLVLFVTTRIALIGISYMSLILVPTLFMHEQVHDVSLIGHPSLDGLCRWDCGWFKRIMETGFNDVETTKVFPLFPALGWLVMHALRVSPAVALILVANVASLASYYVIYAIFCRASDAASARWGLLLFTAYPFAFFQGAAYSEALMVLGSSLAILLAMQRRHMAAGLVLGLGMMARHVTLFAGLGLVAAQIRQRGFHPKRLLGSFSILGLTLPFVILAGWSVYLKHKVGDPFAYWNSRTLNFGPEVFWSVREIWKYMPFKGGSEARPELYFYMAFVPIVVIGTIALFTRARWQVLAWPAALLTTVVLASGGIALGRYSSACWPAFLPLGVLLARRPVLQGPVVGMLFMFQGLFFYLFVHQWRVL